MKQNISFTYTEEYLPTPRCKKFREREVKGSISVNIRECHKADTTLVMMVKDYDCDEREIRAYKGKLYRNVQERNPERDGIQPLHENVPLNKMKWQSHLWGNVYYNACKWNREKGDKGTKLYIKKNASNYLVIDGMVFERTTEPIYNITVFGLNNSAGMFITYKDKFSSQSSCNFSALERDKCHEALKKILSYSVVKHDNSEFHDIKVYASEYVKFKRLKKYEDAV